jgi:molybdopterin-guanine dinucleotide biosynthesis protein A
MVNEFTAIILTGGKSSRMGRPKALLPFGNEPLIAHLVRQLERKFKLVVVVAAPDQELPPVPAKVVRDEIAYQGPVGGIYYGLLAAIGTGAFVTSCDAAFLSLPLISFLSSQLSDYDVVVPYWQDRFQPLHAVYRRSVAPLLNDRVRTRKVDEQEIRRFDPKGLSFFNMNAPDDYAQALRLWQRENSLENSMESTEDAPLSCTVELFGVARLLAKTRVISLSLAPDATFAQVVSAVAQRLPVLVGRVINPNATDLLPGFACNINGMDFVRDRETKIRRDDKIFILSADAGG